MKKLFSFALLLFTCFSLNALAASAKTYQVTGPVLEVTESVIAVQKGQDRWEINRDSNTKVTGDLKVGAKVTIVYTMTAQGVEVKPAAASSTTPAQPAAAKPPLKSGK